MFNDLSRRSRYQSKTNKQLVDELTLFEYACLPGVVGDRFFELLKWKSQQKYVQKEEFIKGFLQVYSDQSEVLMRLTFEM